MADDNVEILERKDRRSLASNTGASAGVSSRNVKYLIDCSSVSDALLRKPLPKTFAQFVGYGDKLPSTMHEGWANELPTVEIELLALTRSALLVLARSHRFVKDISKSTVALYKSLRSLLDNVNNRIVDTISQLFHTTPMQLEASSLAEAPKSVFNIVVPASSGSDTTVFQLAHAVLPSIIHDIRKLLLTLHHNLEKHVVESADSSLLRLNSNEWQAILVELAMVILDLYNWKAKHQQARQSVTAPS